MPIAEVLAEFRRGAAALQHGLDEDIELTDAQIIRLETQLHDLNIAYGRWICRRAHQRRDEAEVTSGPWR